MFAGAPAPVEAGASHFAARERLLNRHHEPAEARRPARQVRAARPAASWAHHQQQQQQVGAKEAAAAAAAGAQRQPASAASKMGQQERAGGRMRRAASDSEQPETPDELASGGGSGGHIERLAAADEQLEPGKQHVGPVMGIFFKVWSLVKVTKMRQHNKMRRQTSDDAGQFHFISGDQYGAGASTSGQAGQAGSSGAQEAVAAAAATTTTAATSTAATNGDAPASRHILRDGHFRRAGSQPPLSLGRPECGSSQQQQQQQPAAPPHQLGGRPQVQQLAATGSPPTGRSLTVSTTNSSSSGVSSATSGSLAAAAATATSAVAGEYELPGGAMGPQKASGAQSATEQASKSGGRSWTARIKGRAAPSVDAQRAPKQQQQQAQASAATAGRGGSYVSRYRLRRAEANLRQLNQEGGQAGGHDKAARQLRSQSDSQQLDELGRRPQAPAGSLLINRLQQQRQQLRGGRARRTQSDDCEEEEEGQNREELARRTNAANSDEDSDLNDIYSTPNDSIQSVPSSQLLLAHEQQQQRQRQQLEQLEQLNQRRASSTANGPPLYPIVKSFSTQNFVQWSAANAPASSCRNAPLPPTPAAQQKTCSASSTSTSSNSSSKTTTNRDNEDNLNNNNNNKVDNARLSNEDSKLQTPAGAALSGSRFFISSSSSEDSQAAAAAVAPPISARRAQIPVHFGLHRHELAAAAPPLPIRRPDSLAFEMLAPPAGLNSQAHNNRLLTPATPGGLVAAMSPACQAPLTLMQQQQVGACGYRKSPSLFEMSQQRDILGPVSLRARFSSRYPSNVLAERLAARTANELASFKPARQQHAFQLAGRMPNSISLHDCKLSSAAASAQEDEEAQQQQEQEQQRRRQQASQYKLAQMLLKLGGSSPTSAGGAGGQAVRDQEGCTALMHAILSDNLAAFKCLLDHGVDLNETNNAGSTALDLICARPPSQLQLEMFNLLLDRRADFDRPRPSDGARLLDRLIGAHDDETPEADKLAYIECLLHNGAKLGSSTWLAASGKHAIQLRLLRKLCQDGYFLYKKGAIEAAVYRFEYALRRIDELEQQLSDSCCLRRPAAAVSSNLRANNKWCSPLAPQQAAQSPEVTQGAASQLADQLARASQLIKYQTYLGLSRCERKRRFFRRALEFAHMSILIDSTSYEGYYSKAHILKDLAELDDALIAIDQTDRLVQRSLEHINGQLGELQIQEESIVFDGCFQVHDPHRAAWIEARRVELVDNLDYLEEAKRHVARLRCEILEDKLRSCGTTGGQQLVDGPAAAAAPAGRRMNQPPIPTQ